MKKKKGPGGRPTKYKPEYCEQIIAHMEHGASMASFAAEISVARSTLGEWGYNYPEFSAAIEIGKAKCAAWWEQIARNGAQGGECNPALVIFGLKNMAAKDWREKQEIDHTTKGESLNRTVTELSDDELASIAAKRG